MKPIYITVLLVRSLFKIVYLPLNCEAIYFQFHLYSSWRVLKRNYKSLDYGFGNGEEGLRVGNGDGGDIEEKGGCFA